MTGLLAIIALHFGLVIFASLLFDRSDLIDGAGYGAGTPSAETFFIKETFLDIVRGEIRGETG